MTRDEIIKMATQAGWQMPIEWDSTDGFLCRLERFATLVAAAEREACAKVCEDMKEDCGKHAYAFAIRARGER
jgi:hypothetical protein